MSRIQLEPLVKSTLADWFATEIGQYVYAWERSQIDNAVEDVFGFNAAQFGLPKLDFLEANRISSRFTVGPEAGTAIRAEFDHLPIASHSLDLVVLPHVLEFCRDPHQVLREAERVLVPEGQIVIAGFNPISLWGISKLLAGRSREWPWRGEFISLLRLRDWLKLLGFELNGGKFGCYAPPLRHARWLNRFRFMDFAGDRWWPIVGGLYVVRAVKRTAGMRLVTPAWRGRRRQVPALAAVARRDSSWASGSQTRGGAAPMLRLIPGAAFPAAPANASLPAQRRRNSGPDHNDSN